MEFEWDASKAAKNLGKHKVSFIEAAHSAGEHRYITVGLSDLGRLLMVAHAERGDRIRIISARTLTRSERRAYEDTQE